MEPLTDQERSELASACHEKLADFWEVLKDEEPDLETAMARFDADSLVTALRKIDAENATKLRGYIENELRLYLD